MKAGLAAVFGLHAVTARVRHRPASITELLIDRNRHDPRVKKLLRSARDAGVNVSLVDSDTLDQSARTERHQGVVALVDAANPVLGIDDVINNTAEAPLLLVLDGIQDPHNLGACLRVADAMGAHAVVAPKDRATGITPTVEKVACGAAHTVPYVVVTNLARELRAMKEMGVWTVAATQDADLPLAECELIRPVALVLGAEGDGLRQLTRKTCDQRVAIPMSGTVESLNVSVAAGICLYEVVRQRKYASLAATASST